MPSGRMNSVVSEFIDHLFTAYLDYLREKGISVVDIKLLLAVQSRCAEVLRRYPIESANDAES